MYTSGCLLSAVFWSLSSTFGVAAMTKEERMQRDLEQMPKRRRTSAEEECQAKQDINKALTSGDADGK